ncbi:translation initiation factor IF-2-like [Mus musculus]|uniref:translation initiation factor IF-2-like n=1 Tax=Mus musculus TaxID=10090 RepID=UPI0005ABA6EA|nr:translation initiation factor IF-2-like [Mus musculus]
MVGEGRARAATPRSRPGPRSRSGSAEQRGSCGTGSGGALVPAPPGAGRGAESGGAARAARVVRAPAAGRGLRLSGVPVQPRSPRPLAPFGAWRPEDLAAPFPGSPAGSGAERWARRGAPWSLSGCCGHPASADGVEPCVRAGCRGRQLRKEAGRPWSRRSSAPLSPSPGRTTAFLPGRRAAIMEPAPSRGRTARRSSWRPSVPGCVDHRHPRACIPRFLAGVRPPVRQSPARERQEPSRTVLLYPAVD